MSAITKSYARELNGEVRRFFETFCLAFTKFDGSIIAQRYATPYSSLNADGALQTFHTRAQIGQYFQGFLDMYHQDGCRSCQFNKLEVVPLGQMSLLASVTWELLREDLSIASTWRESYNLTRSSNELLIYASTDHVERV